MESSSCLLPLNNVPLFSQNFLWCCARWQHTQLCWRCTAAMLHDWSTSQPKPGARCEPALPESVGGAWCVLGSQISLPDGLPSLWRKKYLRTKIIIDYLGDGKHLQSSPRDICTQSTGLRAPRANWTWNFSRGRISKGFFDNRNVGKWYLWWKLQKHSNCLDWVENREDIYLFITMVKQQSCWWMRALCPLSSPVWCSSLFADPAQATRVAGGLDRWCSARPTPKLRKACMQQHRNQPAEERYAPGRGAAALPWAEKTATARSVSQA